MLDKNKKPRRLYVSRIYNIWLIFANKIKPPAEEIVNNYYNKNDISHGVNM